MKICNNFKTNGLNVCYKLFNMISEPDDELQYKTTKLKISDYNTNSLNIYLSIPKGLQCCVHELNLKATVQKRTKI